MSRQRFCSVKTLLRAASRNGARLELAVHDARGERTTKSSRTFAFAMRISSAPLRPGEALAHLALENSRWTTKSRTQPRQPRRHPVTATVADDFVTLAPTHSALARASRARGRDEIVRTRAANDLNQSPNAHAAWRRRTSRTSPRQSDFTPAALAPGAPHRAAEGSAAPRAPRDHQQKSQIPSARSGLHTTGLDTFCPTTSSGTRGLRRRRSLRSRCRFRP